MTLPALAGSSRPAGPRLPLNPRPVLLFGLAAIAIGLGGFATWASVAPLHSAVIAPGTVAVQSKRKEIAHLEGGIVESILVRDGDSVAPGQVLLRLDETRARASLSILRGELDAALASEARLLAEREGLEEIVFPESLSSRAAEPGPAALMAGQKTLFEARRSSLAGEVEILEQRIVQLGEQTTGLQAQVTATGRQIELIADELAGLQQLFDKGHAPRTRILALQREEAELEGERGELIAAMARTKTAAGETRMEIIQLKREFRESVVSALREVQQQLFDLAERIGAAEHVLDHIEVRAPVGGLVVGLGVHTLGGVIRAGETILEIVPEADRLVVQAQVRPLDIDNLVVGQEAAVRITAFKQRSAPTLNGQLAYVSADAITDARSGESYYQARIEIPASEIERLGGQRLQPGMPAEVIVKTGARTALQYLVQPILESADRAWREE